MGFLGWALAPVVMLALFLTACDAGPTAIGSASGQPALGAASNIAPTATLSESTSPEAAGLLSAPVLQPPATFTPAIPPTPAPKLTLPPVPAALNTAPDPSPTPQPYAGLFIADLAQRDYGGGSLEIIDTLESNDYFTRYLITYPSDGLTIYGFMNVPNEGSRFPVVIALHGYIDPAQYNTLDYTTRYADHLARAGYFVIHPNLRGFPPSDEGADAFRVGQAVDVLNLIAVIRHQSLDPTGYLRRADTDDINLWGHSMGGGVVLRVITVDNSPYIRSAILYGAMSGDERRNYERILDWSDGEVGEFELAASPQLLKAISPIYHLDRIRVPMGLHHGMADDVVPPEWSEDLCRRLQGLQHPVECYMYSGMPHTFYGASEELFMERVVAFYDRH